MASFPSTKIQQYVCQYKLVRLVAHDSIPTSALPFRDLWRCFRAKNLVEEIIRIRPADSFDNGANGMRSSECTSYVGFECADLSRGLQNHQREFPSHYTSRRCRFSLEFHVHDAGYPFRLRTTLSVGPICGQD